MRRRRLLLVGLAALLVLAGCNVPTSGKVRPDPPTDRTGWEQGTWYNDPIFVNASDGLNASEREQVVARTMARVERIRGLEFERSVSVDVISRAQYRQQYGGQQRVGSGNWSEQVWEGLWLVGENTSVGSAYDSTFSASVQGFYDPQKNAIVLVSDSETPTVDRWTLAHELTHALQDQHFGLGASPETMDRRIGRSGVLEGDANTVAREYEYHCAHGWRCLDRPTGGQSNGVPGFDQGVFLAIYAPYAEGPSFIDAIRARGGWNRVNDLYTDFPTSSEQLIHPRKYPRDTPQSVHVPDHSNAQWERYDHEPVGQTVGEAGIYAMFWATGQVPDTHSTYDYDYPPSAGWGGDRLVPYHDGDRSGYVWATVWDSPSDAREFERAYRAILDARASRHPTDDTYVLPASSAFSDAFRITREGTRVRIVNAPTVSALDGISRSG